MGKGLNTIILWCNDVSEMRTFYTDLIGLEESYYDPDRFQAVSYKSGDLQFFFMQASKPLPVLQDWSKQPGYDGGVLEEPTWVVALESKEEFERAVEQLLEANVPSFSGSPGAREAMEEKQFFVRDPMGNTVEVYWAPPS